MVGIIYRVKNKINGKIYIGQTKFDLKKRRREHEAAARGNSQLVFHKAIRKYGPKNFRWSILCRVRNEWELDKKELQYINEYNSYHFGYNMIMGRGQWEPRWTKLVVFTEEERSKAFPKNLDPIPKLPSFPGGYTNILDYINARFKPRWKKRKEINSDECFNYKHPQGKRSLR